MKVRGEEETLEPKKCVSFYESIAHSTTFLYITIVVSPSQNSFNDDSLFNCHYFSFVPLL